MTTCLRCAVRQTWNGSARKCAFVDELCDNWNCGGSFSVITGGDLSPLDEGQRRWNVFQVHENRVLPA